MTDSARAETPAAKTSWRDSALAPFRVRVYLFIWIASLASNLGTLIQSVGASWLMTTLNPSPDVVALVQASSTLPIMLLSLPAGAIADIWDRRAIMLIAQGLMFTVSTALALMAMGGHLSAGSLLMFTFLIGCGMALYGPAWQSSVSEQVPRDQLSAAISLNVLSFNIARTVGPAIGGVLVAAAGPQAAFFTNAMSYIALIGVLVWWKRPKTERLLPPEGMLSAMEAGLRYARLSPAIRTVITRAFLFGLMSSVVWALMPLIARDLLGGGALTYGSLFGAFGAGAVVGGIVSVQARHRLSSETLIRLTCTAFGLISITAALSPWVPLTMAAFVVGGAAWVLTLSTFNFTTQTWSPRWVLGRTMAIYQMVVFGGIAIGSWFWGVVADNTSLPAALMTAGSAMLISMLIGRKLPLPQPQTIVLDPLKTWPEPNLRVEVTAESGPVVITVEYRVAANDWADFVAAMYELRRVRRRDGARRWTLLQDLSEPEIWLERFQTRSWLEHLRHRHRFTVVDQDIERRVQAFHRGADPPKIRHLLEQTPTHAPRPSELGPIGERAAAVPDPNLSG